MEFDIVFGYRQKHALNFLSLAFKGKKTISIDHSCIHILYTKTNSYGEMYIDSHNDEISSYLIETMFSCGDYYNVEVFQHLTSTTIDDDIDSSKGFFVQVMFDKYGDYIDWKKKVDVDAIVRSTKDGTWDERSLEPDF